MPARTKSINLLPPSEFESSFWGKFLKWAVTAGRYIIIVTEMFVIIAFLSRFKLDQDMSNLAQTMEGQKGVLESQLASEEEFRQVQTRLETVNKLFESQSMAAKKMDLLVKKIPPEVKLVSLEVRPGLIGIQAGTLSERSLGEMLARMTIEPTWKSVEVTDFSADSSSGINVVLSIKL
jgi:hypothetical protein